MGVRKLWDVLLPRDDSYPSNECIGIDASIWLHKYLYIPNITPKIIKRIIGLLMHNNTLVFVFDGNTPQYKIECVKKRNELKKLEALKRYFKKGCDECGKKYYNCNCGDLNGWANIEKECYKNIKNRKGMDNWGIEFDSDDADSQTYGSYSPSSDHSSYLDNELPDTNAAIKAKSTNNNMLVNNKNKFEKTNYKMNDQFKIVHEISENNQKKSKNRRSIKSQKTEIYSKTIQVDDKNYIKQITNLFYDYLKQNPTFSISDILPDQFLSRLNISKRQKLLLELQYINNYLYSDCSSESQIAKIKRSRDIRILLDSSEKTHRIMSDYSKVYELIDTNMVNHDSRQQNINTMENDSFFVNLQNKPLNDKKMPDFLSSQFLTDEMVEKMMREDFCKKNNNEKICDETGDVNRNIENADSKREIKNQIISVSSQDNIVDHDINNIHNRISANVDNQISDSKQETINNKISILNKESLTKELNQRLLKNQFDNKYKHKIIKASDTIFEIQEMKNKKIKTEVNKHDQNITSIEKNNKQKITNLKENQFKKDHINLPNNNQDKLSDNAIENTFFQNLIQQNTNYNNINSIKNTHLQSEIDKLKLHLKKILKLLNIPYIDASYEADSVLGYLNNQNIDIENEQYLVKIDSVITEDNDVFLYGARKVYKNFFNPKKDCLCYEMESIGMSRDEMIKFAYFLGSDYNIGVKGIGKARAMEIINKERNVEIKDAHESKLKTDIDVINQKSSYDSMFSYDDKTLNKLKSIYDNSEKIKPISLKNDLIQSDMVRKFLLSENVNNREINEILFFLKKLNEKNR